MKSQNILPVHILLYSALLLSGCAAAVRERIYKADDGPIEMSAFVHHAPNSLPVTTADGLRLIGYYWPGDPADHDVVLFFHGRGSNPGIAARYAEHLSGRGDHVIVASYRGFGGNPGSPSQTGLVADGQAFVEKAREIAGPDAHIFLIGHSLGGAVALHVAATTRVSGVVTLSTFDKLAESAPDVMGKLLPDKWNNIDAVGEIGTPFVMMHGTADPRVSIGQAGKLFGAAHAPAVWLTMPGAGHSPDMAQIGPLVSEAVAAIDGGTLATYPATLPPGWSVRRK